MKYPIALLGIIVAGAFLLSGCSTTHVSGQPDRNYDFASVKRVAVVAVEGAGGNTAAQNQVAGMFNQTLLRKGYSPVERQQVRAIMDEQKFQQSDATSPSGAARLGQILNVDAAVTINIPEYGERMSITVQMIDVNSAAIIWTASGSADTRGGLSRHVGTVSGLVGAAYLGQKRDGPRGAVIGGATGAVAGDIAGEAMTPQQQKLAASLIVKLSESLPNAR